MSSSPDPRLLRLLGGEPLAALRQRLRKRFEGAAADAAIADFRLGNLTPEEHAALAGLLGRPARFASSLLVDVRAIDAALQRAGLAAGLRDALQQLDGPIIDRAAQRRLLHSQWERVRGACGHAALAAVLHTPGSLGLLKRLSGQDPDRAAQQVDHAQAVLSRLPAPGLPRAQLAAEVLGDAHALDDGNAVATLVLMVLRRAAVAALEETAEADAADAAGSSNRELWASVGVLVNELARPALFLNLPVQVVDDYAPPLGEPAYLSLRALLRSPPRWQVAGRAVYVCENPNLLAIAADRLGPDCAPLVCTDGMPAAAQRALLAQLADAGAELHYHGDFDWAGLTIGNHVLRAYGAKAWRFAAADYLAAIPAAPQPGRRLTGTAVTAHWDAALTQAMLQQQLAIDEEAVVEHLLAGMALG
ncbi:MAG: TIGR02679 family protein [Methylococcaceae bacterium]|nr:MAG: TIGR02679 family protein [Methylococcaceae bacterium]